LFCVAFSGRTSCSEISVSQELGLVNGNIEGESEIIADGEVEHHHTNAEPLDRETPEIQETSAQLSAVHSLTGMTDTAYQPLKPEKRESPTNCMQFMIKLRTYETSFVQHI